MVGGRIYLLMENKEWLCGSWGPKGSCSGRQFLDGDIVLVFETNENGRGLGLEFEIVLFR